MDGDIAWAASPIRTVRPRNAYGDRDARANRRSHELVEEVRISVAEGVDLFGVEWAARDQCPHGRLRKALRIR
jgi:hypothetical protein